MSDRPQKPIGQFWFDTEFMEDSKTIELLSIGIVSDDGREFYAESMDADHGHANDWVKANVIPNLWSAQAEVAGRYVHGGRNAWSWPNGTGGLMTNGKIASAIVDFVGDVRPRFWAYYGSYDWVVLCQLYGTMMDLPSGWSMFPMDIKQLAVMFDVELPGPPIEAHNALADALWTKEAYDLIAGRPNPRWPG